MTIEKTESITDFEKVRKETLRLLSKIRTELCDMDDQTLSSYTYRCSNNAEEYPFWHLINGPISDALTHVGQINSWRRISGNPIQQVNPFLGTVG